MNKAHRLKDIEGKHSCDVIDVRSCRGPVLRPSFSIKPQTISVKHAKIDEKLASNNMYEHHTTPNKMGIFNGR